MFQDVRSVFEAFSELGKRLYEFESKKYLIDDTYVDIENGFRSNFDSQSFIDNLCLNANHFYPTDVVTVAKYYEARVLKAIETLQTRTENIVYNFSNHEISILPTPEEEQKTLFIKWKGELKLYLISLQVLQQTMGVSNDILRVDNISPQSLNLTGEATEHISTNDNPLRYFEHFITQEQVDFVASEKILSDEVAKSKSLIEEKLHELPTSEHVIKFLILSLSNLNRYLQLAKDRSQDKSVDFYNNCLYILIQFLKDFSHFPSKAVDSLVKILLSRADNNRTLHLIQRQVVVQPAFQVQGMSTEKFIAVGWTFLKTKYIKDTDFFLFGNLFTAELPYNQHQKIAWQHLYRNDTVKKSLFYLFEKLQQEGHITRMEPGLLKEKLQLLFCNQDGSNLKKTVHQNYLGFKKDPGKHPIMDDLLANLRTL